MNSSPQLERFILHHITMMGNTDSISTNGKIDMTYKTWMQPAIFNSDRVRILSSCWMRSLIQLSYLYVTIKLRLYLHPINTITIFIRASRFGFLYIIYTHLHLVLWLDLLTYIYYKFSLVVEHISYYNKILRCVDCLYS